jgi:hypothetical protein
VHDGVRWVVLADDGVIVAAIAATSAAPAAPSDALAGRLGCTILGRLVRGVVFILFVV